MKNLIYKRVQFDTELHQILALQKVNLPNAISDTEKLEQGFVTVNHSFDILKAMNRGCPHIIATYNNDVIGYALCMLQQFKNDIPVLKAMFSEIDSVINDNSYITMGQICIAKKHRGKGVFRGLYKHMKVELKSSYNKIITEVDSSNIRSLQAHYAIGFKHLKTYNSQGQNWELIVWDWT